MNKEILRLAIPNILSNISIPLISSVDTILMGRLSVVHLGAVGLGSMIFNFIYWNFGFLRMGTTGITAQAYGNEDREAMILSLTRSVLLALVIAFILLILREPLYHLAAYAMSVSPDQNGMVTTYFYIRLWAAPATLLLYGLMGWFFGMQNALIPLALTILINISNIVLSYVLVYQLNWEIEGVAWGTVIAQYIGVIAAFIFLLVRYRSDFKYYQHKAILHIEGLKHFFSINRDLFIRTVALTFAFAFFYRESSRAGAGILAINVVLLQFINWMSYGVDGFAYAAESIVGKYKGKKDSKNLDLSIQRSLIWGGVLAIVFTLAFWLFGDILFTVFTSDSEVATAARAFLPWVIAFPIFSFWCYIWDGIFIGLTASRAMRNTMYVALTVYLIIYFSLSSSLGNHALWLALMSMMVIRGGGQYLLYRKYGSLIK